MRPLAFGPGARERARQFALAALALSLLAIGLGAWRFLAVRGVGSELRAQVAGRQGRLADDRRVASGAPGAKPDALDRSRAVSRLRTALGGFAGAKGCAVEEFQASTDEVPYLTVYALDSKDSGWMQVPVRAALRGRATDLVATLAALRTLDVPFEVDTVELTRNSTDNNGMAKVVAQLALRILVYKGEG